MRILDTRCELPATVIRFPLSAPTSLLFVYLYIKPLGFLYRENVSKRSKKNLILLLTLPLYGLLKGQNLLVIPSTLSGTTFNLDIQAGTQTFYSGKSTPTYGINGTWLGPTLMVNKGDSITLNVKNNLTVKTTMHWHGLHVAAHNDGGPHQIILPGATWSPSFRIRNNASTFWYHPHGQGQTDPQVSKGLAGLIIVRDNQESALTLPRNYGVDDIPLIVQSKAFDVLQQIAIATDMDTALFVNGTLNPYFDAPAQVLRFRVLNGSSMRSYYFGFSNNLSFYQIGTDGGLLDTPQSMQRILLSPGERAEILVNFAGKSGQTLYLMNYGSELPAGIYGSDSVGDANNTIGEYKSNFLNGTDRKILQLNIVNSTSGAVTSIPNSLVPFSPYKVTDAKLTRTIVFDTLRLLPSDTPNRAEGPFGFDGKTFNMDSINQTVYLNNTEIWNLVNKTLIAHPFHIHNVQFNIIEEHGVAIAPAKRGWKDVVLVMPHDSAKFITRFTNFTDPKVPYMYHCHLLHHEDDGMMGSFVVVDPNSHTATTIKQTLSLYPNPADNSINIRSPFAGGTASVSIFNTLGAVVYSGEMMNEICIDIADLKPGVYWVRVMKDGENVVGRFVRK